jgi:hypothetical protein
MSLDADLLVFHGGGPTRQLIRTGHSLPVELLKVDADAAKEEEEPSPNSTSSRLPEIKGQIDKSSYR